MQADPTFYGTSRYERQRNDAYDTPSWVTELLLENTHLGGPIWEACAGARAMMSVLESAGYRVLGSDIAPRADGVHQLDLLDSRRALAFPMEHFGGPFFPRFDIVTNPPFGDRTDKLLERILVGCLKLMQLWADHGYVGSQLWLLMPLAWDSVPGRATYFRRVGDVGFYRKIVINDRIQWFDDPPPGKKKAVKPRKNHMWCGWRVGFRDAPTTSLGPH
jgi:hypothetical protein